MSVVAGVLTDGQQVDKTALRRYLEHRENPNLLDYGADPTGRADSAAAVQRALDEAHGRSVEVPAGVYLLSRGLLVKAPADAHVAAPRLIGAGSGATRFECRMSGAAFTVDQSAPYRFASQGAISGVSFTGDKGAAGLTCFSFTGAWGWRLSDVSISGFSGDGIDCPARRDLGGNPDGYQTILRMEDCRVARCGGWGLDGAIGTGLIATLIDCAFHDCGAGGLRASGPLRFSGGGVSGCGATGGAEAAGLRLYRAPGQSTPQLLLLERLEFDGNHGAQVRLEAALGGRIEQCRFISRVTGKIMTAAVGVKFGPAAVDPTGGNVRGVDVEHCYVRAPADSTAPSFTAFDFGAPGGYGQISLHGVQWIALAPHHRKIAPPHPDAQVRFDDTGPSHGAAAAPAAAPVKEAGSRAVLAVKQTEQPLSAGRMVVVMFDRAVRASAAGLWRIDAWLCLVGATVGDVVELTLAAGPKTLRTIYAPIVTAVRQTIDMTVSAPLDAGVTIELRIKLGTSGGARILSGGDLSALQATLLGG